MHRIYVFLALSHRFVTWVPDVNTLRPRQNGRHFADDIFKCIFLNENVWIGLIFNWSLFLWFELTIFQHWYRWWLGAEQATTHYLNQWWLFYWCIYASLGLNKLTWRSWINGFCKKRCIWLSFVLEMHLFCTNNQCTFPHNTWAY